MNWTNFSRWVRFSGILFSGLCLILFLIGCNSIGTFGWCISMIFGLSAFSYARRYVVFTSLSKLKKGLLYNSHSVRYGNKEGDILIADNLKKLHDDVVEDWYPDSDKLSHPVENLNLGDLIKRIKKVQRPEGQITTEIDEIVKEMISIAHKIDEYIEEQEKFRLRNLIRL